MARSGRRRSVAGRKRLQLLSTRSDHGIGIPCTHVDVGLEPLDLDRDAGNSGGALVNTLGELIGINSRRGDLTKGAQNIGFAIPAELARDVMDQIIDYGTVRRGWLGATYSDLPPQVQPDGTAIHLGIRVREVQRGGPAWTAGIRPGDLVLSLDGELVSDASRFRLAISQRVPGSDVELDIRRGNEPFQTYATLIQQPPL